MSEEETKNDGVRKSDTVTFKKDDLWRYSTFALLGILVLGGVFVLAGQNPTGNAINDGDSPQALPPKTAQLSIEEGDHVKGDESAEVVVFEFSDFECPFCGRFYTQTLGQIESEFIDTGKIKFVYSHFPLSFHPNAQKSAEAFECAGEQGMAYEMHDLLFENGVEGGVASFKAYAGQLGLDQNQFNTCLDSGKYEAKVKADMQRGVEAGVTGTPGFLIGSNPDEMKLVSGACPFTTFQQAINAEMEGKEWTVTQCAFQEL